MGIKDIAQLEPDMRKRLRPPPPETFANSVTRTSANIDAAFATPRRVPTDG
jgi:hypothetical protein